TAPVHYPRFFLRAYTRRVQGSRSLRSIVMVVALAGAYYATARLGLHFATVTQSVTLVWPPTGLSLAAVLLFGQRGAAGAATGIAVGAFAVNALTPGVPPLTALGIAAGNTLEALAGAAMLRRLGFNKALARIGDVARLLFFAAILSTSVSA